MTEHNQQFEHFPTWVNMASSWLTRRGPHVHAVCIDAKGRACLMGKDFMRARDEDAFPVRWLWPEDVVALAADRDKWRRLDAEAATHVESVICMRTGFTAEPPYVGWKGLGLALSEALDDRDRLAKERDDAAEQIHLLRGCLSADAQLLSAAVTRAERAKFDRDEAKASCDSLSATVEMARRDMNGLIADRHKAESAWAKEATRASLAENRLSAAIARAERAEVERDEAKRELRRAADHLREFANAHSMEATAETWAILHCAAKIVEPITGGSPS